MSKLKTDQKHLARERFLWLMLFMAIFTATFSVASEIELEPQEAKQVREMITEKIASGSSNTIFLNNIVLGLIMFIPALGIILGIGSAFATGIAFSTFGLEIPAYLILFITPFGFMELLAYSIAMSRSFLIIKYLVKHIRQPRKLILIEIGTVTGLIFFGSIIEAVMISRLH